MISALTWILSLCCILTEQSLAIELKVNDDATDGVGFYQIYVNNELWLESGQMDAYFNNQWYTTNTSKSKITKLLGNNLKSGITSYEQIKLLSISNNYDLHDDFAGEYSEIDYKWITDDDYSTTFHTIFKIYSDKNTISFVQSFPNGVSGTNFINESFIPADCEGDNIPNPILTFPSFNTRTNNNITNEYSSGNLGYLTWKGTFSTASYGKGMLTSSDLGGINGGPVVLFNQDAKSIVISSNDHFNEVTKTTSNAMYDIGTYMYDGIRNDSLLCLSEDCYDTNTNYPNREVQGYGYNINMLTLDLIPLHLWYSDKYSDNYVATTSSPPDSSYTIELDNGYIFKTKPTSNNTDLYLSLDLYYNSERNDHATIASETLKTKLVSLNYTFISTQGYILNPNGLYAIDNDLQIGISSSFTEIPSDFTYETVIVESNGINNAMIYEWGNKIQSLYQTNRITGDNDILTSKLGYWTDDGAYYYGDSWSGATAEPQNLTCCSYDIFKSVKENLDTNNIPIQYWQMDDWWYIGTYVGKSGSSGIGQWGGIRAVKEWKPPIKYYPGGLLQLSTTLNIPLLLYGPYFSPNNQWYGEFNFIPDDGTYVLPTPNESYNFYKTIMKYGIDATTSINNSNTNSGMIGYEVDFMSCLSQTPYFRLNINSEQEWLNGMNKAAKEYGLIIQYCMSIPSNLLSSLSLSQVTNGRASGDYAASNNYNIGTGAILWHSLSLKPSKDNFWTSYPQPHPNKNHPNGNDQSSCELMAIVALFSCGPVGISDKVGYTNKTLIMRTTREDGRLLQPIRPITAIDDQFIQNIFIDNKNIINVWSTESGPKIGNGNDGKDNVEQIYQIILAIDMKRSYQLTYNSFNNQNGMIISNINNYIIRNWHNHSYCINGTNAISNGCIQYVSNQNSMNNTLYVFNPKDPISPSIESFELILITEGNSFDNIIFLGELDKYVSVSQHRFSNLVINGNLMSVNIRGKENEIVHITILYPNQSSNNDWQVRQYDVTIPENGQTTFELS